jgi:phosphoribosylformimino-5-aminoimidazole carboxamide ribotide isomerase
MDLYPAIDLLDGRCVRLHQGNYERQTIYGDDPVAQAQSFQAAGAGWIHVVDLDAARSGDPVNHGVIAAIAAAVDVPVQTGGGVRTEAAAELLFEAGVARVVLGTVAATDPDLVRRLARRHRVAVGLDARGGEVMTDGWTSGTGRTVIDMAFDFADAGVEAFVVTDVARDGTLSGPDVAGLTELLAATRVDVIASGGVGTVDDLRDLAAVAVAGRGLAGVIVGKALYEGRIELSAAVSALSGAQP